MMFLSIYLGGDFLWRKKDKLFVVDSKRLDEMETPTGYQP
jgi:hypothetical protein